MRSGHLKILQLVQMSLNALRKRVQQIDTRERRNMVVFPAAILDGMQEHTLCMLTGVNMADVHTALLCFINADQTTLPTQIDSSDKVLLTCVNCNAESDNFTLDTKAGEYVCDCGVVQPDRLFLPGLDHNINTQYRGVEHVDASSKETRNLAENLNVYVNNSSDDLNFALTILHRTHSESRVPVLARVVAALLYPMIKTNISMDSIPTLIQFRRPLPNLYNITRPPAPLRVCSCGHQIFSKSDQRRHSCSWGQRRREGAPY